MNVIRPMFSILVYINQLDVECLVVNQSVPKFRLAVTGTDLNALSLPPQ